MRKTALLLAWLAILPSLGAADEGDEARETTAQTYESPILSLLLLPVNVLIKMASVLTPAEPPKGQPEADKGGHSAK